MRQPSDALGSYATPRKSARGLAYSKTSRKFLARMETLIPWTQLLAFIEPFYPKGQRGRPPVGLERRLRVCFLQQCYFDNLIFTRQVQFDIIGESYYPFWHGSLDNLANCLTNAARRYGKPVIVAETAFPWTNSYWTTNFSGIPGTTNGQVQFVVGLAQAVKSVPNNLGAGIFWWGTEYQKLNGVNESGFNTLPFSTPKEMCCRRRAPAGRWPRRFC